MAVSKRLRFEILRRDDSTCQTCGRKAPDVELQVDAVIPDALGGSHKDPSNLVTKCADCNAGKSSSSPDAATVAAVAEDALRWSQAMAEAGRQMSGRIAGDQELIGQFDAHWGEWTYGPDKAAIPRPGDWSGSVAAFLAAGLPMDALLDCIRIAMVGKAKPEHTWRYMCGVAWGRVRELQAAARRIAAGGSPAEAGSAAGEYERGRLDLARELLQDVTAGERDYFLEQADMSGWRDEDEPEQTQSEIASSAVQSMLNEVRCDWDYLCDRLEGTLRELPDEIGTRALEHARAGKRVSASPYGGRTFTLANALNVVDDLIRLPWARGYLQAMPEEEQAAWRAYARALHPRADLDDDRLTSRAATCAEVVLAGGRYEAMCASAGDVIPACSRRAEYYARFAEASCCQDQGPDEHKGHPACAEHMQELLEGRRRTKSGKPITVTDHKAAEKPWWED